MISNVFETNYLLSMEPWDSAIAPNKQQAKTKDFLFNWRMPPHDPNIPSILWACMPCCHDDLWSRWGYNLAIVPQELPSCNCATITAITIMSIRTAIEMWIVLIHHHHEHGRDVDVVAKMWIVPSCRARPSCLIRARLALAIMDNKLVCLSARHPKNCLIFTITIAHTRKC